VWFIFFDKHQLDAAVVAYVSGQLLNKNFGQFDGAVLQSAAERDAPDPFTRVLHFHALQAVKHAAEQGWDQLRPLPDLSGGDVITPGWKDRIALWQSHEV
jgi:hypothetical protein